MSFLLHLNCSFLIYIFLFFQNEEDNLMFDKQLLKGIDLSEGECRLHECGLSVENPGDNLILRPSRADDYDKGKPNE